MSNTASATKGGGIVYTSGAHHKYFMPIQEDKKCNNLYNK
jgi:hypothetical protein